jgi:sugar/nucleoside kinase (ribokinase family)
MGSQGSLLMTATHKVEVPAFPVSAVDTTGAGDAFMGATLYTLLQQEITSPAALSTLSESALHQMGRFANKAASLTCTRYGGIVSLPFLKEFEGE